MIIETKYNIGDYLFPSRDSANDRFIDNGDGTITDTKLGLMWSKATLNEDEVNHEQGGKLCADLDLGGHTDWRLPTIEELFALGDRTRHNQAIDTDVFPDTRSDWYWSSTICAWDPSYAWIVNFGNGCADLSHRGYDGAFVRAVRSVPADLRAPLLALTEVLRGSQQQCDEDGTMIAVSRQALDETLAAIESLAAHRGEVSGDVDTALDAVYDDFCAKDNGDVPLERYPQGAVDALARAGWAVVPCNLPHKVLGNAAVTGVLETGNPKHCWDYLIAHTRIYPNQPLPPQAQAGAGDAARVLLALAEQYDEMSQAALSEDEYDRSDVWQNAASQARARANQPDWICAALEASHDPE